MTRIGINPARNKISSYSPARVTVAVLTYIPHLEGYFRHRLDVLKLVIGSLKAHTRPPYDLFVFDNGSCPPVVDCLSHFQDQGIIDYLLLSQRNLGKIGAFKILFEAAPGDIVAYSDDDVFFYPGWLESHLEILEAYPKTGMVSGAPIRDAADRSRQALKRFIDSEPKGLRVSYEQRIPEEWEADWAVSTGRDPEEAVQAVREGQEIILNLNGVEAYGSASHFQFVSPREVILQALPDDWSGRLMGHMVELDEAIDDLGYLRLCTVDRYTRHIGNALSQEIVKEVQATGITPPGEGVVMTPKDRHWILRFPGAGRALRLIYNRLFEILNGTKS